MSTIKQAGKWLKKKFRSGAGFTLVEMLAAIGVAGILGGIVTPAAINSLAKSRQAKCAENLRQFGTALVQYVTDTGTYPASATSIGDGDTQVRQRWYHTLSPYMGADERARTNAQGATGVSNNLGDLDQTVFTRAYICPEVEGQWKIGRNNSYGYNFQYLGNARRTEAADTTRTAGAKRNGMVNFPVRLQDIRDPARTIAIADSDGTGHLFPYKDPTEMSPNESTGVDINFSATGNAAESFIGPMLGNRLTTLGNEGYQLDPTFIPCRNLDQPTNDAIFDPSDDICGVAGGDRRHLQAGRGVVSNRHDGGANVAFADGHVEFFSREALYIHPITGMPSNRLWNGFGRDNDENGDGIVTTGGPIFDNNEWICDLNGNGIADAGEANTVIGAAIGAGAPGGFMASNNNSFMVGSDVLNDGAKVVNTRGGVTVLDLLQDPDGPTLPKTVPFPLITTVLAQSE